eukprot:15199-Prymnesium_polylepis.3
MTAAAGGSVSLDAACCDPAPSLRLIGAHVRLVHGNELGQSLRPPNDHLVVRLLGIEIGVEDRHVILDGDRGPDRILRLRVLRRVCGTRNEHASVRREQGGAERGRREGGEREERGRANLGCEPEVAIALERLGGAR